MSARRPHGTAGPHAGPNLVGEARDEPDGTRAKEPFQNVYEDPTRASSYADLEFPGSYYLAFRDLPDVFQRHVSGRRALDFGCGAGRSSRFLNGLGYDVVGVDISEQMLLRARERDPAGDYRLIPDGDLGDVAELEFDLVFSAFTFDNVASDETRLALMRQFGRVLADDGRVVNVVSAPEIYVHEWASFSTTEFAENLVARDGDRVRIRMLDVADDRPVEDVLRTPESYQRLYAEAGLEVLEVLRPLGSDTDGIRWVSEHRVSPWAIWVLGHGDRSSG